MVHKQSQTSHHHKQSQTSHHHNNNSDENKDNSVDTTVFRSVKDSSTTIPSLTNLQQPQQQQSLPSLPICDLSQSSIKEKYSTGGVFSAYSYIIEQITNYCVGFKFASIGSHHTYSVDYWKLFLKTFILPHSTQHEILKNSSAVLQSLTTAMLSLIVLFGVVLGVLYPSLWRLAVWCAAAPIWHFLEYSSMSLYHPEDQSYSHFALNMRLIDFARFGPLVEHLCLPLLCYVLGFLRHHTTETRHSLYYQTFCSSTTLNIISLIGLILMIVGQYFRTLSMSNLGNNFQYTLLQPHTRKQNNRLITTGIHSFVRHPSYSAMAIYFLGLSMLLCNPFFTTFLFLVSFPLLNARANEEERFLLEMYPIEYVAYMKSTPRFIPNIINNLDHY